MNQDYHLQGRGLTGERGERTLFNHIDFSLKSGEVLHLSGPNGSGKTTLLRMLCGLLPWVSGQLYWQGQPVTRSQLVKQTVYIGHQNALRPDLSVWDNLKLDCLLLELDDTAIERALTCLKLRALSLLPVKALSHGQQRCVALARLMLGSRPLWILDEPFSALDDDKQQIMTQIIEEHVAQQGMVLVTSHQPLLMQQAPRCLSL